MKELCNALPINLPRTKYNKWASRYYQYARKRRKPVKDKGILTRALLNLLSIFETFRRIVPKFFNQLWWMRRRSLCVHSIPRILSGVIVVQSVPGCWRPMNFEFLFYYMGQF